MCGAQLPLQTLGGVSSAEVLTGQKLETSHNALLPVPANHSREPNEDLRDGSIVNARYFRPGNPAWAERVTQNLKGSQLYKVTMEAGTWIRRRHRMRKRYPDSPIVTGAQLFLEILLDTFNMPKLLAPTDTSDVSLLPRRKSDCSSRRSKQSQVIPRCLIYE